MSSGITRRPEYLAADVEGTTTVTRSRATQSSTRLDKTEMNMDSKAKSWPEQDAIEKWRAKYCSDVVFSHAALLDLKNAVTAPRLEVQEHKDRFLEYLHEIAGALGVPHHESTAAAMRTNILQAVAPANEELSESKRIKFSLEVETWHEVRGRGLIAVLSDLGYSAARNDMIRVGMTVRLIDERDDPRRHGIYEVHGLERRGGRSGFALVVRRVEPEEGSSTMEKTDTP